MPAISRISVECRRVLSLYPNAPFRNSSIRGLPWVAVTRSGARTGCPWELVRARLRLEADRDSLRRDLDRIRPGAIVAPRARCDLQVQLPFPPRLAFVALTDD